MCQPIILNRGRQVVYISNVGGVTAGQAQHNSSNVGGVTAGQVGHNSSYTNNNNVCTALRFKGNCCS